MRKPALPEIDIDRCTGCGECVEWCPPGAVKVVNGKVAITAPEDCRYCAECEVICPAGAIRCPFQIVLVNVEPEG